MTIHILLQCSKSKNHNPSEDLIWSEFTNLDSWNNSWNKSISRFAVKDFYSGRSIKRELAMIESITDKSCYIISAGAGLVTLDQTIPSYDASLINGQGPNKEDWFRLPHGGLEKINLNPEDRIVSFASPLYHRALLSDPSIQKIASRLIVAHTSPLSKLEGVYSIEVHPRTTECLGIASIDLNTELLRIFLEDGIAGFEEIYKKCQILPPPPD